jgi:hypothetical protein
MSHKKALSLYDFKLNNYAVKSSQVIIYARMELISIL